jgi:hypothetical protein
VREIGAGPCQGAARLQDANSGWLVMWSRYERAYFAFPLFADPPGPVISAPDGTGLMTAMRAAELAARPGPAAPSEARSRRGRAPPGHGHRHVPYLNREVSPRVPA